MHFQIEQSHLEDLKAQLNINSNFQNSKLFLNIQNILLPTAIDKGKTTSTIYITCSDIYNGDNHIVIDGNNHKERRSVLAAINAKDDALVDKKDKNDSASITFASIEESHITKGNIAEIININSLEVLNNFTVYLMDDNFEEITFQNKKLPIRITLEINNILWN